MRIRGRALGAAVLSFLLGLTLVPLGPPAAAQYPIEPPAGDCALTVGPGNVPKRVFVQGQRIRVIGAAHCARIHERKVRVFLVRKGVRRLLARTQARADGSYVTRFAFIRRVQPPGNYNVIVRTRDNQWGKPIEVVEPPEPVLLFPGIGAGPTVGSASSSSHGPSPDGRSTRSWSQASSGARARFAARVPLHRRLERIHRLAAAPLVRLGPPFSLFA